MAGAARQHGPRAGAWALPPARARSRQGPAGTHLRGHCIVIIQLRQVPWLCPQVCHRSLHILARRSGLGARRQPARHRGIAPGQRVGQALLRSGGRGRGSLARNEAIQQPARFPACALPPCAPPRLQLKDALLRLQAVQQLGVAIGLNLHRRAARKTGEKAYHQIEEQLL